MKRLRRWARYAQLIFALLVCVPLHYLWRLVRAKSPWPRIFLGWCGWICGLRVTVKGSYRRDHCLFVANHSSWLDILAIGGTAGAAFVAKAELAGIGFIKWMADFNDTIYIARQDRRAMHGHADAMRVALESGRGVCIFPEATTDDGTKVLPFKPSLLSSIYPPIEGVIVQPIALDFGTIAADIAWGVEDGDINAKKVLSRAGTIPLTLHFLDPIVPGVGMGADRKLLAAHSHREIVAALGLCALGEAEPASDEASAPLYAGQ